MCIQCSKAANFVVFKVFCYIHKSIEEGLKVGWLALYTGACSPADHDCHALHT